MGFQKAATPIMEQITDFHTYVTVIITVIALFVTALLIYVMARFNESRNPVPSRPSHNTLLEIAWTGCRPRSWSLSRSRPSACCSP